MKKAAAENTRAVTSQLGEQAEDALQRLSATHAKLEAAERRLESLGVDAVALHVGACWGYGVARCVDASRSASMPWKWTRNVLAAFGELIASATANMLTLQAAASLSLQDAQHRNEQAAPPSHLHASQLRFDSTPSCLLTQPAARKPRRMVRVVQ